MERNTLKPGRLNYFSKTLFGVIILLFAFSAQAQNLEIGLFGGGSYYLGELNPGMPFAQTQASYGISGRYYKGSRWSYRLSYYRGKVTGSDEKYGGVTDRDLSFVSDLNDFALVAEFNFWPYFTGSKMEYFTPYIFGGIGFFTFSPKTPGGVKLQPQGTEGQNAGFDGRSPYNQYSLSIPFGFGFKYSLSKRVGINLEWGMRKTFTDYVDDISTTYADNPDIIADPTQTHSAWQQRGEEKNFDWVAYAGVTISYKFDLYSKKRCNSLKW
ncbi:MAG: DUF6089 family protein [Bacteroidales bacterium]|jgi:hypothetical protein|nr:DUF6089 family protein [Bacteroidales bacterium]